MKTFACMVDDDDARSINEAIAHYQATRRWENFKDCPHKGTILPDGDSDLAGAIIGEICRVWMDADEKYDGPGAI